MSAKKQESTVVTERRLRPIYDSLDIGNNKVALQEGEKLLKKQPDLICAKALRALALIRLSRHSEAATVLAEIEQQDPDEEYTLQALTYCYRDLGTPDRIIALYERTTKKHPQNEEFLSHLMMAYVRVGDYKRQNHIAMQLYKLRPAKNPYYFWSVMGTVMQAYEDPKLARTMYLPLAERMIQKFVQDNKLNAEAEVKLYILILEMQEKYVEAVGVIQGNLMQRFVKCMWEANQKLVDLLEKLQRWREIYDICERGLSENTDDWFLWSHLFSSAFSVINEDESAKSSMIDQMTRLVLSDQETAYRGPYLARMKLIVCLLERDYVVRSELGTSPLGEPRDLLLNYFHRFGDRPCLFDDVKPYLWLLGEEQQNDFISQLEESCDGLPVSAPSSQSQHAILAHDEKQMVKHQSGLQLARCLGRHASLSPVDKQQLVTDLVLRYQAALQFGSNLLSTEMQPADGYLLLALHTLWDMYVDQGDLKVLFEMIFLAEQGLKRSASNFRLKSVLMKLYTLVGGGVCILRLSESMDIKYVLRDTLWYLVCDHLSPWGMYVDIVEWSRLSVAFYTQSEKEIVDCVVQCYKSGSFPKIVEFFDFRKKLRNSFHLHACHVWRRYFSLICDGANLEFVVAVLKERSAADVLKDSREWSSLGNNCDYTMLPCWDPDELTKTAESKRQTAFQQEMDQLRFYQLVLALLSLLAESEDDGGQEPVDTVNGVTGAPVEDMFSNVVNELRAHCRHCRSEYSQQPPMSVSSTALASPVSGYFGVYLDGNYVDVLLCALEIAHAAVKGSTATQHQPWPEVKYPPDEETRQLLKAMFSSHQLHGAGDGFPFMQICHVSFLVQTLSVVLIGFSLAVRRANSGRAQRHQSGKEKKQKKKKGPVSTNVNVEEDSPIGELIRFASIFGQAAETTLRLVDDLAMLLEADLSLCSMNENSSLSMDLCTTRSETACHLRNSYKHSIRELQRVMTHNLSAMAAYCPSK